MLKSIPVSLRGISLGCRKGTDQPLRDHARDAHSPTGDIRTLDVLDTGRRGYDPTAPNLAMRIGQPADSRRRSAALIPRGTRAASAMRMALDLGRQIWRVSVLGHPLMRVTLVP